MGLGDACWRIQVQSSANTANTANSADSQRGDAMSKSCKPWQGNERLSWKRRKRTSIIENLDHSTSRFFPLAEAPIARAWSPPACLGAQPAHRVLQLSHQVAPWKGEKCKTRCLLCTLQMTLLVSSFLPAWPRCLSKSSIEITKPIVGWHKYTGCYESPPSTINT